MPQYVDGYVLPVPKKNIAKYRKLARLAKKIYLEYGALDYRECVGDDLKPKIGVQFPKMLKAKPSETVVFAWIAFKSKAHRNQVLKKVLSDARMQMDPDSMPFEWRRMLYGGFKTLV